MKRPKHAPPQRPLVEEIESRILYSGDLAPGLPAVHALADGAEVRRLDDGISQATDNATTTSRPAAELVVVDMGIANWQSLLDDLDSAVAGRRYDVVLIDSGEDGIARISEALATRHDLDAVHLISHGSPGTLDLGASRLDFDGLLKHAGAIRRWGEALSADADILIYGCDVAATAEGRAFVDALGRLTGADVAASTDKTGSAGLGGNWTLELATGAIEARPLAASAWQGVFALVPQGGETRVNSNTAGIQFAPFDNRNVAMDANGNSVVVWQDQTGLDGSGSGIYAQRYDSNGTPLGANFRVNTHTTDHQSEAQVAMAADGSFVVVWQSQGQDGGGWGVYAQRYDAAGVAQGGEFRVNTTTVLDQAAPAVAMDAAGNFVVVWQAWSQDAANTWGIYAQRYDAAGVPQGGEFLVNITVTGDQTEPAIAMDAAGNFVVVWQSQGQDGSGLGIYAQRYDAAGIAQGAEFRVNATTADNQELASVAMDATGFVVSWDSTLQDGSGRGVYARRYDPAGLPLTGEIQVAATTLSHQWTSSVAMTSGGGFIVSWTSDGQDGDQGGIYVRQFDAYGQPLTVELRVNTTTAGLQDNSSIATSASGHAVVVWYGAGVGDADGVFLRPFRYMATILDRFGAVSWSNNDGTEPWLAAWQELGESDGPGAGFVEVDVTRRALEIGSGPVLLLFPSDIAGLGTQRTADLSQALRATLSLDAWRTGVSLDGVVTLSVSADGTNWTTLATFDFNSMPPTRTTYSFDITPWASAATNVRLVGSGTVGGVLLSGYFYFDNIGIDYEYDTPPTITSNGGGATAALSVAENTTAVTTVTAIDADIPAQTLTYSIAGGADAARFTIHDATGVLSFLTPPNFELPMDADGNNVYEVIVQVTDGHGGSDTQAISVTVTNVNEAPAGADRTVTTLEDTAYVFTVADFGFSDPADAPANNLLAVRIAGLPGAGSLTLNGVAVTVGQSVSVTDIAAGRLVFTPAANGNGTAYTSFAFQVQDDGGTANGGIDLDPSPNTLTIDVTPVNDAPVVVTGGGSLTYTENEPATAVDPNLTVTDIDDATLTGATVRISANYANGEDVLGFTDQAGITGSWNAATGTLTLSGTATVAQYQTALRSVTYQNTSESPGIAVRTVEYTVSDGTLTSVPATRQVQVVSVNDAPVTHDAGAAAWLEDVPWIAVSLTGSDVDGMVTHFRLVSLPTNGQLYVDAGLTAPAATGVDYVATGQSLTLYFVPNADWNGITTFQFAARDNDGALDPMPITAWITVVSVNDAPQGADRTVTTLEDTPYVFAVSDFGFSDPADVPANDFLAVRIAGLPGAGSLTLDGVAVAAGQSVSVTDIAAGRLVFTPAAGANGAGYAGFGFQVQDDGGTANGGTDLDPSPNTLTIDVIPVNDAPTVTPIDLGAILEDGSRTITQADLLAGAGDVDGDALTAINLAIVSGSGTLTDHGDGTWTYTPTADWNGAVAFAFDVSDGMVAVANSATLTVTPVNDAPILAAVGDRSVNEGEELRFTVSASDVDTAVLTYSLADAPAGAGIDPDTGIFTWTPTEAQGPGSYSFDIVVSDGSLSDRETVTVTVHEVNDAPVITSNGGGDSASVTVPENTTTVTTVTATDADIPAQTLTYGIAGGADADKFVIDAATGELTFVTAPDHEHPADADGDNVYELVVRVSDGSLSDEQFIAVTVANVNDNAVTPLADTDDAANRVRENAANGTSAGVTAFARDADAGDTVTYSLDDDAGGRFCIDAVTGVVTVADGSRLDYEAATAHTVTVRATSSDGSFSTLSTAIRLENLNDTPPVLTLQTLLIDQGAAALLAQAIAATDADGVPPWLSFEVGHVVGGHIESLDAPGVAITRFDQADLLAGRIRFVHDGSASTPAFDVSVSDGVHDVGPLQAMIEFRPSAPAAAGPVPSVTPVDVVATPATVEWPTPTQARPSPSWSEAIADRGPASAEQALLAESGSSGDYRPLTAGEIMITVPEAPQALEHDPPTYAVRLLDQLRLELANYSLMGSGGSAHGRIEIALPSPGNFPAADSTIDKAVTAARLAGITFSVGAVWWALRVGGLMASLFASAPAWRQFDPLPILRNKEDEDDHGRWIEHDVMPEKGAAEDAGWPSPGIEVLMQ